MLRYIHGDVTIATSALLEVIGTKTNSASTKRCLACIKMPGTPGVGMGGCFLLSYLLDLEGNSMAKSTTYLIVIL